MQRRRTERRTVRSLLGAALLCAFLPGVALAQPDSPPAATLTGEDFAGVILPVEPTPGSVQMFGHRAWVWQELDGTRRVVIEGDVRVLLGGYDFHCKRAALWLEDITSRLDVNYQVFQVYAVFDKVDTPAADASIALTADRLPVQAAFELDRPISLRVDLPRTEPPSDPVIGAFLDEAQLELRRTLLIATGHLQPEAIAERPSRDRWLPADPDTVTGQPPPSPEDTAQRPPADPTDPDRPALDDPGTLPTLASDAAAAPPERPAGPDPIFIGTGWFYLSAEDRVVLESGEDANTVRFTGGVVIQYQDRRSGRSLEITAERGIMFLSPGPLQDLTRFRSEDVEGIYLEGEVQASDGSYTLRGPQIYYDVRRNRALVLDAVFWAYEQRLRMPLYVRAKALRQESAEDFSATKAHISNTAFFNPHFSIGTSAVTVNLREDEAGRTRSHVTAKNIILEGGGFPLLWWPVYSGDPELFPLRGVSIGDSNRSGTAFLTTWNPFSLLGLDTPDGINSDVQIDYYSERGFAVGTTTRWTGRRFDGRVFGYLVFNDTGTDVLTNGEEIDRDGITRGIVLAQHRWKFAEHWTLFAEGSYISDEALLPAYFPRIAERASEITNRLLLRRLENNTVLTLEAKAAANDFIPNEYLVQTPGYMVDKLPEVSFTQVTNDLLPNLAPGMLTHNWEASVSNMRLQFSEVTAKSLGFNNARRSMEAFGTGPNRSLGDTFRAAGLDESLVMRFDTRHELSAQLKAGPIQVTPFVVGRATAYDEDFEDFSGNDDKVRLWGAAGATFSTTLQRVNNGFESRFLDIHRMRHLVEPHVTVWYAESTIPSEELPVYDDDIEPLLDGALVNVGIDQTWQTKRGGPGRLRSVDVFRLNAAYTWTAEDDIRNTPIGRYYDSRPELSVSGEYLSAEGFWRVSEVVALAGETIFDLDLNQQARTSAGVEVRHTPDFLTTLEMRYINSENVTYGTLTSRYKLTDKYSVKGTARYNFEQSDFQSFGAQFLRNFPNGSVVVTVVYNNIRGETGVGFSFRPLGAPTNTGSSRLGPLSPENDL